MRRGRRVGACALVEPHAPERGKWSIASQHAGIRRDERPVRPIVIRYGLPDARISRWVKKKRSSPAAPQTSKVGGNSFAGRREREKAEALLLPFSEQSCELVDPTEQLTARDRSAVFEQSRTVRRVKLPELTLDEGRQ